MIKRMLITVLAGTTMTQLAFASDSAGMIETKVDTQLTQYMQSLAESRNSELTIDLNDAKQHEFVMQRLAASNTTSASSPQLYRMLKSLKTKQLVAKNAKPQQKALAAPQINATVTETDVNEASDHTIFGLKFGALAAEEPAALASKTLALAAPVAETETRFMSATALSTVEGGSAYTMVDLILYDQDYKQIATLGVKKSYAEGKQEYASSAIEMDQLIANNPGLELVIADSMSIVEDAEGNQEVTYKVNQYPVETAALQSMEEEEIQYDHKHPTDVNGDNFAMLCLNRAHADCDYSINQEGQANEDTVVSIPWQGEVIIPHRVVKVYTASEDANGVSEHTEIRVNRKEVGGSTALQSNTGKKFSDYIIFDNNEELKQTTISWNIPREDGVFGNATLFDRYQRVDWWWHIVVELNPYYHPRRIANGLITATTVGEPGQPTDLDFKGLIPLQFAYSCLAKGSLIEMANGKQTPIEKVNIGDVVKANGINMRVADTSIGTEIIPMVRIVDNKGHSVLLTESHPVETPKGIVWANELKKGDWLFTESGKSKIVSASMEDYDDNIYNLKLEAVEGQEHLVGKNSNAFYANGIRVGDLSMQADYEFKNVLATSEDEILRRLPERWHQDYYNNREQ